MNLSEHLAGARARLARAGVSRDQAAIDADFLARHALGWDRAYFVAHLREPPPEFFSERYEALISRREQREPAHLIVGTREFWGRPFKISRDVLTPRPETELIVEEAIALYVGRDHPDLVVDVGTGSGCIGITLALELRAARVVATDVSSEALEIAAANAAAHGVSGQLEFVNLPLLGGIESGIDLIVSNPPYVPSGAAPAIPPEVSAYEPAVALYGGADGLGVIRGLLKAAQRALRAGGYLVMEFGFGQDEAVEKEVIEHPRLQLRHIRQDLQGIPRVLVCEALSDVHQV